MPKEKNPENPNCCPKKIRRDIATAAMQGLLCSSRCGGVEDEMDKTADWAVKQADALLKALGEKD